MPRLMVMRLGNDHTNGISARRCFRRCLIAADNDQAVAYDRRRHFQPKFWTSTAIFIVEDDAQNGPDHVDSHRSPAFVISAYTQTPHRR